jgi:hypothetical protein
VDVQTSRGNSRNEVKSDCEVLPVASRLAKNGLDFCGANTRVLIVLRYKLNGCSAFSESQDVRRRSDGTGLQDRFDRV